VTICNLNPFNEKFSTDYINKTTEEGKCFSKVNGEEFAACLNQSNSYEIFEYDKFIDRIKRTIANDKSLTDIDQEYYGYSLQYDMLLTCNYNQEPCNSTNFIKYWDNIYGNCYTFNSANNTIVPLKSSVTAEKFGLKMELVVSK
jgi:hypothetical protein